ncbi:unnamed protein product [Gadus morhua 'NCC']
MTTPWPSPAPSSAARLLFLLLLLLPLLPAAFAQTQGPVPSQAPPPTTHPLARPECSRKEHPKVSIQALSPWISFFSYLGVRDYSQLTLDLTRNELILGARNYLFRLDLGNMSLIQVIYLQAHIHTYLAKDGYINTYIISYC